MTLISSCLAKIVKLGKGWITALFGQDRARRNAFITSESRGSDADHLCSILVLFCHLLLQRSVLKAGNLLWVIGVDQNC